MEWLSWEEPRMVRPWSPVVPLLLGWELDPTCCPVSPDFPLEKK